jgi:cobalt-zinc-cadmium resistance protein CzcA
LGIPLAFGSQIAKSKSYQYEKEALLKNKESALLQFEAELQSVLMKHEQLSEQLVYYQEFMLPNAQQLVQLAIVSYRAGEINYLEYLQTLETNLDTEMGYLSTINAAKQNLLHFEYLTQHKN